MTTKAIEDLTRYPDWTLQVVDIPAVITCTAAILDKQTFHTDVEDTYQGIKGIDLVPNRSPQNMASIEIGKDFMHSHGYIKNDFDVHVWAAPEFLEQAAEELDSTMRLG